MGKREGRDKLILILVIQNTSTPDENLISILAKMSISEGISSFMSLLDVGDIFSLSLLCRRYFTQTHFCVYFFFLLFLSFSKTNHFQIVFLLKYASISTRITHLKYRKSLKLSKFSILCGTAPKGLSNYQVSPRKSM